MPKLTDAELITELAQDRQDNAEIDLACINRLKLLASEYGKDGRIATDLLDIVRRLLDL